MSCGCSHNSDKYSSIGEFNKHSCGCASGGGCCKDRASKELDFNSLSVEEKEFLAKLVSVQYLPLVQFVVKSSKEHDFNSIALPTVYIEDVAEPMEVVKARATMLNGLTDKGFITLDYDIELENCDYNEYFTSELFAYFKSTVQEGAGQENFLGDIADIFKGSIAPTNDYLLTIDDSEIFTSQFKL